MARIIIVVGACLAIMVGSLLTAWKFVLPVFVPGSTSSTPDPRKNRDPSSTKPPPLEKPELPERQIRAERIWKLQREEARRFLTTEARSVIRAVDQLASTIVRYNIQRDQAITQYQINSRPRNAARLGTMPYVDSPQPIDFISVRYEFEAAIKQYQQTRDRFKDEVERIDAQFFLENEGVIRPSEEHRAPMPPPLGPDPEMADWLMTNRDRVFRFMSGLNPEWRRLRQREFEEASSRASSRRVETATREGARGPEGIESAVLLEINARRRSENRPLLSPMETLNKIAADHALAMAERGKLSIDIKGWSPSDAAERSIPSVGAVSVLVASRRAGVAAELVEMFRNRPEDRSILLGESQWFGIGKAEAGGTVYWSLLFGQPAR